jgi:HD-GYP domain-containing protein (c-di-GMP phosphodiesterase class II)
MSSDPPNASISPTPDQQHADRELVELVRLRGAPLLEALEAHAPGSREHAEATGRYAVAAAAGIGLDRSAAELCRETAKLHDVGMIYVPAEVTRKPFESWGSEEREVFDAHYDAGARLARGAGIPEEVCDWLLQIRERFDGGGADGLAGPAIPVAARITRAACACATLRASAASDPETIERLRAASTRELDPGVVEALVRALQSSA